MSDEELPEVESELTHLHIQNLSMVLSRPETKLDIGGNEMLSVAAALNALYLASNHLREGVPLVVNCDAELVQ